MTDSQIRKRKSSGSKPARLPVSSFDVKEYESPDMKRRSSTLCQTTSTYGQVPTVKNDVKTSRNVSEKIRRDRMNLYITELCKCIPYINQAQKRLDRTSVLRLSVSYLRFQRYLKSEIFKNTMNARMHVGQFLNDNFLKDINAFFVVFDCNGSMLYLSDCIKPLLGHEHVNLIGYSACKIIHEDDCHKFLSMIYSSNQDATEGIRRQANIRMLSLHSSFHLSHFEMVQLITTSHWTLINKGPNKMGHKHLCIFGIGRILPGFNLTISPLVKTEGSECRTMHDLDGRVTGVDNWATCILGYFNDDISGNSCYQQVFPPDAALVFYGHKKVLKMGYLNTVVFRMVTCDNRAVYVNSQSSLMYDEWTKKPKGIITCHRIIDPVTGKLFMKAQWKRWKKKLNLIESSDESAKKLNSEIDDLPHLDFTEYCSDSTDITYNGEDNSNTPSRIGPEDLVVRRISAGSELIDIVIPEEVAVGCDLPTNIYQQPQANQRESLYSNSISLDNSSFGNNTSSPLPSLSSVSTSSLASYSLEELLKMDISNAKTQ